MPRPGRVGVPRRGIRLRFLLRIRDDSDLCCYHYCDSFPDRKLFEHQEKRATFHIAVRTEADARASAAHPGPTRQRGDGVGIGIGDGPFVLELESLTDGRK